MHNIKFSTPYAVTLTLKQHIYRKAIDDIYYGYEELDFPKASKTLKHFLNILNRKIFGHKATIKGKMQRLNCFPVIEGGGSDTKHIHIHMIIDRPVGYTDLGFKKLIIRHWKGIDFANEQTDIQEIHDIENWQKYISKELKHKSHYDHIDYENIWDENYINSKEVNVSYV